MPTIRIPVGPLFSFRECRWFLHRNFDDCMHVVEEDQVKKALLIDGHLLLVSLSEEKEALRVQVLKGPDTPALRKAVTDYITDWWDLDRDLLPFYQQIAKHKQLAYMAADYKGLRLLGMPDLFEAISWAIIGQQINLSFAYKLKRRLVEKYGTHLDHEGSKHYLFPSPEALMRATPEDLRAMQFSQQKIRYLLTVAEAFFSGGISKQELIALPDFAARQQALLALKGVGIWTANYALMKSLKEPGSIPHGDAGLLNALLAHSLIKDKSDLRAIERLFAKFAGWESYLVIYLWRSLAKMD